MVDDVVARLDKLDNYLNALNTAISRLKSAVFVENTKLEQQFAKQAELVLNEIDKEIANIRRARFLDEVMDREVNQRLQFLLEEARRIADKRQGNIML